MQLERMITANETEKDINTELSLNVADTSS